MLIKFTEIDIAQPLQSIYLDNRYSWVYVLVRWKLCPIGLLHVQCLPYTRVIEAKQLHHQIIETFGWNLWERALSGGLNEINKEKDEYLPPISVIVCTRDRAESLERCLQALKQLDYPKYEVVVVDNHSRDVRVAQVVENSGFRYVREDTPGLNWARNRGAKEAQYNIIAYIDDDALATSGWLRGIAYGFENSEIMAVTGMVLPAELETAAQIDFEVYGGMNKGFTRFVKQRDKMNKKDLLWASGWGVGANMAFRRDIFEKTGNFDVALDVGTPTNGGGDIEFFYRIVSAGYKLCYEPAATVYHVHRRDNLSLKRQIYNNGRSFPAYLLTIARNEPGNRTAILWFAIRWWGWEWLLRRLVSSFFKRDSWTFQFAMTELKGAFSSLRAYRKSQRIARQYFETSQSVNSG